MKIIGNYDIHIYGIKSFKTYSNGANADINGIRYTPLYEELKAGFAQKRDANLISMVFGHNKIFNFNQNRAYDLLLSILGEEKLVKKLGFDKNIFDKYCESNGLVNVLNDTLQDAGIVVVTEKNASNVIGITGMNKNGRLFANDTENLFLSENMLKINNEKTESL